MKPKHNAGRHTMAAAPADRSQNLFTRRFPAPSAALGIIALLCLMGATAIAQSPWVRFDTAQIRVTVPLNTTNSVVITNLVNVSTDIVSAVNFDVSGLPAGAGAVLTDTNGNALLSTTIDTNLWLTLNTTNIAEGVYTFYLNASGGAANRLPFVLQAAHVWNGAGGAMGVTNLAWSGASNWFGGIPTGGCDVVFGDIGAQTNVFPTGFSFTNSIVDTNTTIGSLRFSQTGVTNAIASDTNAPPRYHTIQLKTNVTLTVSGTNGFSLLRDYIDERYALGVQLGLMGVNFVGGAGSKLVVSNETANFGILLDLNTQSSLNMTNLLTFVADVNRMGIGEYQIYPNYRALNDGFNGGRDTNNYAGLPRRFAANLLLARTNIIKAVYKDPDNYTNENTRGYAISQFNGEQYGNGSSINTFFYLGGSNAFLADSVCFIGANHATGNGGACSFGINNGVAWFRSTNGGRMSLFAVADDGGPKEGSGNVKATIDFSALNGLVDVLATNLYVARDRTLIRSNDNPTTEATLVIGRGTIDVNTAILGFQEHSNKIDWTTIGGAQVYRGYCHGTLIVTNGGTFKVNGNLTLGYTADTNPEISAQQYNTYGQITVYSNSTVTASNLVVDTGLNFTSQSQQRQNNITVNQGGSLIVTNTIGQAPGLPVDNLTVGQGGILGLFVAAGKTNINVRNLLSSGTTPGIIKVLSLPSFPSYPTNIPIISYASATPFLAADMSAIGGTVQGYIVNNAGNQTIDLFLTTNAPNLLTWVGNITANWDLTTKNWVTTNGVSTNFTFGDIVTFNDSSTVTNVSIVDVVVPNQATNGVVITNNNNWYTFNAAGGGAIAGTAKIIKSGTNNLTFNAIETGPLAVLGGALDGSGVLGVTTVASNGVINFAGTMSGLTSTGAVILASGGIINGAVSLQGGTFVNNGTVNTPNAGLTMTITNTVITNNATMNIGGSAWDVTLGSVLANFGTINNLNNRMNFEGLVFGTGGWQDPDGGLTTGVDGRVAANPLSLWSPGAAPNNSIGSMYVGARVDLNNTPGTAPFGIAQLLIEVDFNNAQTNDIILADKWNNITGMILMTNINPSAGSFANGQIFQVFANNNGLTYSNSIDVNGTYPVMWPPAPAPGLQWNLMNFRAYGTIGITNSPLVWDGTGGGVWDTNTANTPWKGGKSYTDNQGAVFDDSASSSTTVTLSGALAPGGYVLTTNIVGGVTNIYASGPAVSPGIVVSNAARDYTFVGNGKITGITGLYKTGPGTLTVLTSNDFNGTVIVDGGTLVVSNAVPSGNVAALGLSGNNNEVILDGATLKYVGTTNVALNNFLKANPNGATVQVASSTNELNLNKNVFGPGTIIKTGPGVLVLGNNNDTYSGGTVISAGTLRLTNAAAGFGGITLNPNTTLQILNSFNFTNGINVAGSPTTIQVMGNATNVLGGAWTGSGSATLTSTGTVLFVLNGSMAGFSGTLSDGTSTNTIRFNSTTNSTTPPNTGSAAATFDLGTGAATLNNVSGQGLTYDLGALAGGPNTVLSGSVSNTATPTCTYSIGAKGSDTTFAGTIANGVGAVSVTKVGSGTLLLNGVNTYTGPTLVSNGTLGGSGSIAGNLIVQTNATLAPGASIGTFTVGGAATLSGAVVLELNQLNKPLPNDRLSVAGTITASGTLLVTNAGTVLYNYTKFQLFNKAVSGFAVTLPAGYTWQNDLAADGSITLLSGGIVNPTPVSLGVTQTGGGGGLTFAWPYDHTGWLMYSNSVGLLDTNMWFPIAGSGATNQITTTIDSNQPNVFFRLKYP